MVPSVKIKCPVCVTYKVFFPDKRARDISNYEKLTTDLMVNKGLLPDDDHNWIRRMVIEWGGYDKSNPRIEISIDEA